MHDPDDISPAQESVPVEESIETVEESPYDGLPPAAGLSRRGLLVDLIAAGIGAAMGTPLAGYFLEPLIRDKGEGQWVKIGPAEQFRGPSRSEVEYSFNKKDAWLTSLVKRRVIIASDANDPARFTVFSSTCTHLGCGVRWDEAQKQFHCPCHGGVFDAEGRPAGGPVPRPLDRLQARIGEDGQLEVLEA